jgi:hypothetical protein
VTLIGGQDPSFGFGSYARRVGKRTVVSEDNVDESVGVPWSGPYFRTFSNLPRLLWTEPPSHD